MATRKYVTFFQVSYVDMAGKLRPNGERDEKFARFRTEEAATAFAATVQGQAFTAPGVCSLVPAKVWRARADARIAAKWVTA